MLITSFIIRLPKNLLSSIDVTQSDEVDVSSDGDCEDEMVKRSAFKNLNKITNYLILEARLIFIQLKKTFTIAPIF